MTKAERVKEVVEKISRWRHLCERVEDAKQEAAALAFSYGSGGVQTSSISDKTYRGAALLAGIERDAAWVNTIREGMRYLQETRPELAALLAGHYCMDDRRGHRKKRSSDFAKAYQAANRIRRTTYDEWRREALDELAGIALQNGLQYITRSYRRGGK